MSTNALPRHPAADQPLWKKLWIYQADRFPIFKTTLLLGVFSAASISVSAHLGDRSLPGVMTFFVAWFATLVIFFQMRACDEYKDLDDDRLYRPERPIPSGLVSLRLIISIGIIGGIIALSAVSVLSTALVLPLLLVWVWLGLMTMEFFVPKWIKARPLAYLVSHMAIMPLIDLFITASEWLPHGAHPPPGLWLFLFLSFVNGCVLEIGRKLWAPENERNGVETYSGLLGPARGAEAWATIIFVAYGLLCGVGVAVGAAGIIALAGLAPLGAALWAAWSYRQSPTPKAQKRIDTFAGLWVLACYSLAGFAPLISRGST